MEVSGLTRDVSPPVPELEVQSLQFRLSPEMPVNHSCPSLFNAVSCSCICRPLPSVFHSTVSAVQ